MGRGVRNLFDVEVVPEPRRAFARATRTDFHPSDESSVPGHLRFTFFVPRIRNDPQRLSLQRCASGKGKGLEMSASGRGWLSL